MNNIVAFNISNAQQCGQSRFQEKKIQKNISVIYHKIN